jgi:hypothetical protein
LLPVPPDRELPLLLLLLRLEDPIGVGADWDPEDSEDEPKLLLPLPALPLEPLLLEPLLEPPSPGLTCCSLVSTLMFFTMIMFWRNLGLVSPLEPEPEPEPEPPMLEELALLEGGMEEPLELPAI